MSVLGRVCASFPGFGDFGGCGSTATARVDRIPDSCQFHASPRIRQRELIPTWNLISHVEVVPPDLGPILSHRKLPGMGETPKRMGWSVNKKAESPSALTFQSRHELGKLHRFVGSRAELASDRLAFSKIDFDLGAAIRNALHTRVIMTFLGRQHS